MHLNRRGVSIVEFLIAFGLLAVVASGIATIQTNFMKDIVRAERFNDMNFLNIKIRRLLTVRGYCNGTFGALTLSANPAVSRIVDAAGTTVYQPGQRYEKEVSIDRMRVANYRPGVVADEMQFDFEVTYSIGGLSFLNSTVKIIPVFVKVSGATFVSCFTPGDIGTDAEYIKEEGSDTRTGDLTIVGALEIRRNALGNGGVVVAEEFFELSDKNLKKNIHTLDAPLNMIQKITGYSYIKRHQYREYGFIAQELEPWTPLTHKTSDDLLAVKYYGIIPVGVESLKEISENQDDLLRKIRKQKKKLQNLNQ